MRYVFPLFLIATSAIAADAPNVTLTQDEVNRLIQAEAAKAVASFVAQEKAASAQDVYEKLNKGFAPKSSEPSKP